MMNFLLHWFTMGGYGFYVWLAYGIVFVILGISCWETNYQRKRIRKKLQNWFKQY